jgi:hypothetical protein
VSGATAVTIPIDSASNRVQGASYDAGGNATTSKDARWAYEYDSLNMMTRVRATPGGTDRRMIYDASDERIGTILIQGNPARWTFRDFDGRILREYTSIKSGLGFDLWTWEQDYFYGENGLIGGETLDYGYTPAYRYGGRRHYHLDHLGNVRMVTTDPSGTRARSIAENDYYPFGTTMTGRTRSRSTGATRTSTRCASPATGGTSWGCSTSTTPSTSITCTRGTTIRMRDGSYRWIRLAGMHVSPRHGTDTHTLVTIRSYMWIPMASASFAS